ncbi:MAG: NAD-dependent epimerase/dehydratase family protein [Luteibaculaceae bacterium]
MILLTGATGLLGSHFAYELLRAGYAVRAVKRPESNTQLVLDLFHFYNTEEADTFYNAIEWVTGSLNDLFFVEQILAGVDTVIHAAAMVSSNEADKKEITKANLSITENLLNESLRQCIKQFIFISSTAALGSKPNRALHVDEKDILQPNFNTGVYSLTKFLAEMEVWRAYSEGLNGFILNPCVVLGPGNLDRSSLTLINRIVKGFKFYTKGANAVVDARDVAHVLVRLLKKAEEVNHNRYIVTGEHVSFKDLFFEIADQLKKPRPKYYASPWFTTVWWRLNKLWSMLSGKPPGFTKANAESAHKITVYSNDKLKSVLGDYSPIPYQESIHNTLRFSKLI